MEDLQAMIQAVSHRGPDGERLWTNEEGTALFGHRRLAIIDLSDLASQPMQYMDRYCIVHNGEIYNYIELRFKLIQKGYSFQTSSDTEVILAAYDCWKENCVSYLEGMFAFAIWDNTLKTFFATRDHFGQKPFYYIYNSADSIFRFASEIKSFYNSGFSKQVNNNLLFMYLTAGFTINRTNQSETFDSNIKQLPPSHFIIGRFEGQELTINIQQYWDIDKEKRNNETEAAAIEGLKENLMRSVSNCMRSDVKIGTSLSGGLDSSAIVGLAAKLNNPVNSYRSFTARFPGYDKDETIYSNAVASKFKLEQHTIDVDADQFASEFEKFLKQHDEPVSSSSAFAQYKVYGLAGENKMRVLLDGQGADEVLAGYLKYIHWYLQEILFKHPLLFAKEKKELKRNGYQFDWGIKNMLAAVYPAQTANFLEKRLIRKIRRNRDLNPEYFERSYNKDEFHKPFVSKLNDILYYDTMEGGLQELLRYADRNSMAHGCEVRLPFLDHKLVQYCFSLASSFKIHRGYTKWILREAMKDILPEKITWRKDKIGFEPPQRQWMENKKVQELIRSGKQKLVEQKILRPEVLNKKIQPHDAYAADNFDWRYMIAGWWMQI